MVLKNTYPKIYIYTFDADIPTYYLCMVCLILFYVCMLVSLFSLLVFFPFLIRITSALLVPSYTVCSVILCSLLVSLFLFPVEDFFNLLFKFLSYMLWVFLMIKFTLFWFLFKSLVVYLSH